MAISWGALDDRLRVGIDVSMSPSSVTSSTASVTLTWKVYVTTDGYGWNDTQTATMSNAISATQSYNYVSAIGASVVKEVWSGSQTVSTSYSSSVSRTLSASISGAFNGATPSHSRTFTIPQRPPQLPDAPTAASATYVNDNRIDLAWTRPASASTAEKTWAQVVVTRWTLDLGGTPSASSVVATLPGASTSWTDLSVVGNSRFQYAVRGSNDSGWGSPLNTSGISTTPSAPTSVQAAKDGAGDIVVTWTDMSPLNTLWEIQDETTTLSASLANTPASFTHVGPNPSVTHRYRVRAIADGPRYSAWSAYSNTVQLQAAPAAPDDLTPNGASTALDDPLVLSWSHNPVDTTPQTAYELDHRLVGAGTWTTVSGTTDEFHTLTGYTSQASIEWRVRTKGAHVDWSPYSAVATVPLTWRPTATLSAPGATVTTPSVTASWAYYHAGSRPQSGWEVQVRSGSTLLAQGSGSGTTSTWTSGNVLPNLTSASVRVRVRETSGLWSEWDEHTFTVNYDPPAESSVAAAWQDGYGNAIVTAQAVSDGVSPATVSHSIERSVDGGNTWVTLAEDLSTDASFIDWEAPAGGTYHYRVSAFSALPSVAQTVVEVTVPATRINDTIWISGGPGFALAYALPHNPDLDFDGGRDRTLHSFAGRTLPVEFSARTVPTTLSVSATFMPDHYTPSPGDPVMATRADLEDIFSMPGPHLYRDPLGRVLYGTVSALRWSREPGGTGSVSFTITRSTPPTSSQAASMQGYFAPRIAEVSPGVYELIGSDVVEAEPGVFEEIG